jgi:phage antirepressor YoqD-like protein
MLAKTEKAKEFRSWVRRILKGLRKGELELLQKQLEENRPKLELYEQVINARSNMTMLQVAKVLKLKGRNKLFKFLRDEDILMSKRERHNIPKQQFIDAEYFVVVIKPMFISGQIVDIPVTLVTPKGMQYILKRWNKKKNGSQLSETI